MGKKTQKFIRRATVIGIEEANESGIVKIHVWAVYGGGNQLKFRCPFCGLVDAHGANGYAGAKNGTPMPHCNCRVSPHFGKRIEWVMHEVTEGMDVFLAGDLGRENKTVCLRRAGERGYDQLDNGQINYSASPRVLMKKYKKGE